MKGNSIRVSTKITGLKELDKKLEDMPSRINRGRDLGLKAAGLLVQNRARELVQKGPKSGKVYTRRGRRHQASAPGEAPATDTGNLVRNIVMDTEPANGSIDIVSRAIQSFWLELGTRLMAPRPFLLRSLTELAGKIGDTVRRYIANELKYD